MITALDHLTDPAAKLRLIIKRGLQPQAAALLASLAETRDMSFCSDIQVGKIFFDVVPNTPETIEWVTPDQYRILLEFPSGPKDRSPLYIDLAGMAKFLGWTKEQVRDFIRPALERIAQTDPKPANWRLNDTMTLATRTFFSSDDPAAKGAERWCLLSRFRDGRLFELRERALPVPVQRANRGKLSESDMRDELHPIVDRMLELGMSMDEIRKEFIKWIVDHKYCQFEWMLAVAGAKCFRNDPASEERRREALRKHFLPGIKKFENNIFKAARIFAAFDVRCIKAWKRGDDKFIRPRVLELLARGNAGDTYQWLLTYGERLEFYPWTIPSQKTSPEAKAWEMLRVMAKAAAQAAIKAERYGVAAALAHHFNEALDPEKMRELTNLAMDLEQPVALKWNDAIRPRAGE